MTETSGTATPETPPDTAAAEPNTEADTSPPEGEFDPDRARAEVKAARDEARNLRKRLREVEPLAEKARQAEDASKSDAQKWQERYEALLAEKASAEHEAMRERVARQAGLPDDLADLLQGTSEADMTEHAKRLSVYISPKTERRRDPSQGVGGDDVALNGDPLLTALKTKLHIP